MYKCIVINIYGVNPQQSIIDTEKVNAHLQAKCAPFDAFPPLRIFNENFAPKSWLQKNISFDRHFQNNREFYFFADILNLLLKISTFPHVNCTVHVVSINRSAR